MTWGVIGLLLAVTAGHCMEHVCPQGGCGNITVNLGARWGTKITVLKNEDGSIDVKMTPSNDTSTSCISSADNITGGDDKNPRATPDVRRLYNVKLHRFDSLLNLSGNNYTGDDIKMALKQVKDSTLRTVAVLYLSHNNITSLPALTFPETLEGCRWICYGGLLELHLDHTRFEISKESRWELSRLQKLQVLNLSRSEFSRSNDFEFLYLPFLQHLDLSYNQLTNFPIIPGLTGLRTLDLTGNYLTSPYSLLTKQQQLPSSLDTLLLAHNGMTSFYGLKKSMLKLDISNNSFSRIWDIDSLEIQYLQVGDNPWKCDCSLVKFISRRGFTIQDKQQFRCTLDGVKYRPFENLPILLKDECSPSTSYRCRDEFCQFGRSLWHAIGTFSDGVEKFCQSVRGGNFFGRIRSQWYFVSILSWGLILVVAMMLCCGITGRKTTKGQFKEDIKEQSKENTKEQSKENTEEQSKEITKQELYEENTSPENTSTKDQSQENQDSKILVNGVPFDTINV